jgi:hypothetical protein
VTSFVESFFIFAMPVMSAVHEQMQQRAGKQEQPGQPGQEADQMGPVLGQEKEGRDRQKGQQH